ncbi:uncharacterized protein LOC112091594 [Morus notabilis]|uniref:uncharacterized protein LOC112091594 n=1 Tax=Morus notabilis TaxID=981085 RepID=UPI000CED7F31|nr:uncharacterized protein LOC112091594 [Morus notabilis]
MSPSTSNGVCNTCGYDPSMQRGVVKTCLDCFLDGHRLHRFEYEVSSVHYLAKLPGTCYTGPCDNPDVVVGRATKILDNNGCADYGNFKLFDQNSVSFAVLCMTGHPQCAHEVSAKSNVDVAVPSLSSLMSLATTLGLIAVGLGGI